MRRTLSALLATAGLVATALMMSSAPAAAAETQRLERVSLDASYTLLDAASGRPLGPVIRGQLSARDVTLTIDGAQRHYTASQWFVSDAASSHAVTVHATIGQISVTTSTAGKSNVTLQGLSAPVT